MDDIEMKAAELVHERWVGLECDNVGIGQCRKISQRCLTVVGTDVEDRGGTRAEADSP
jgi:hypothetical protein